MTNAPPNLTNSAAAEIELGDDILDIRPPVDIPTGWEWLLYAAALLVVAALVVLLARYLRRRLTVVLPPPIPYVEPHALARRRLEAALRLIDDPERFCIAVSAAVRGYFEGRYRIHAPDRTTDEFLEELRGLASLTGLQQEQLAGFLAQCDLVKFARDEPTRNDLERLHQFALTLVEATMPDSAREAEPAKREVAA